MKNSRHLTPSSALPSSAAFNMLSDMLQRFPGIGSAVYLRLDDSHSRRAMRLVCKQLRAAIDDAVSSLFIGLNDIYDPDEVLQRLARTSLRPSKLHLGNYSGTSTQPTLMLAALAACELVPVLHGVQHLTLSSALPLSAALVMSSTMPQLRSLYVVCHMDVSVCRAWQRLPHLSSLTLTLTPASGAAAASLLLKSLEHITSLRSLGLSFSHDMVDEGSLSACTQLTALRGCRWFPALTQLTKLLQLGVVKHLASDSLPLLATLPQLADLRLESCPLQPSSQLSRFLSQHLTSLTVTSIHSRDLAALDCPQLQTLTLPELLVDSAASLRACASGILQHCSSIYNLFTYNHGQEFKTAAAGAEVRQLGPPPSTSALLEALTPWQPQSGKAIERLGLWHLPDVTREALEWLPVNIKYLTCDPSSSLDSCDDLLPRSSAASLLQQLGWVEGDEEDEDGEPRSASFTWVLLAWAFARARYHHHQLYDKLREAVLQGLQGSHLMPRLQQTSRAAPRHPSSSSSSAAATHSSHEHCQAALLRAAAPVLSARILQGQLSSRRVACVAWAYARLQQLEPRLVSAILRHSMAHAEQYELRYWARLAWAFSTLGLASEEAYHQRLARLMQERQQQLQRPTPAAGAVAAAQGPSRLQQRGRGHTAAPAARPGAGQGPRVGLECADEQDWMGRSRAHSQLLLGMSYDVMAVLVGHMQIDEGSLAASTQLTKLDGINWFPGLTQLTQLQQMDAHELSSDSLPLLATLPQLTDLRLRYCPLQSSTQQSRFLFQHLTSLKVDSIHSRDLAGLDCLQLQTLAVLKLQVNCTASLRACASGILQHCCAVRGLEFRAAAVGAGMRQLGPPPSASLLLEALAPWQPRSGKAIEMLGLERLSDVTREALEWLPVNIQSLELCLLPPTSLLTAALSDVCDALSGAAATQLPSLGAHELAVLVEGLSRCQLQGVDPHLFAALGHAAVPHVLAGAFSPGGLASLLAGFARARQRHAPLGSAAARVAALQAEAFTCLQLATLLWALSVMRVVDRQVVDQVAELLLQGPLAGPGLGAGGRPGRGCGQGQGRHPALGPPLLPQPRLAEHSLAAWVPGLQPAGRPGRVVQQCSLPAPAAGWVDGDEEDEDGEWVEAEGLQPCYSLLPLVEEGQRLDREQQLVWAQQQAQQLLWAFASQEHCQAALLRGAAPVLSARILQGQLSSRRVACVAWAYARLQQLEPRLLSAILRHSMAHAEQYELRYWARLAWALSTLGLA
ncbi:hypothetical protein QJQ45_000263 [Haematococcus lacustris]|nr:hypothetical protein QJQ45_000263 [Haematococcus lacustris]